MNIKESLIQELKSIISQLDNQINREELEKITNLKQDTIELQKRVITISNLKKERLSLDKDLKFKKEEKKYIEELINSILNLFPTFNKELLDQLKRYVNLWDNIFFNPNKDEVLNNLNSICTSLLEEISKKEESISAMNNPIIEKQSSIEKLITNIENNYTNIFNNNIDLIVELLKEKGKSEKEILEFLRTLFLDVEATILFSKQGTIQKSDKISELEEEILEQNEDDIETIKQKIIKILNENGYGELIPYIKEKQKPKVEKTKDDLFIYGNINNIEEIIKTFKKYNINLLEEVDNGNLFKIFNLLLYSSKENIETIFKLALEPEISICKYDKQGNLVLDEKGNPQINFTILLERASRFISRKKRYKRKGNNTQNIEIDSEVEGNLGDYIKNIRFFQDLGVDIKKIFEKIEQSSKDKGNYFDIPHEKILRNKAIFDKYNISSTAYLSKLYCFEASTPADTIDMFIELDILEYIQTKVARLNLLPDHPIIYRIVRTYQLADTLPNPNNLSLHQNAKQFLFKNGQGDDSGKLDGYIANPVYHISKGKKLKLDTGIDKQNGSVVTEKYTREEVLSEEQIHNFKCFDEIVKANENISVDLIDERSLLIRKINNLSRIVYGQEPKNILIFGKEPKEIRISKLKFFRIYNTLCKNGFNLENDRDCVLYALTYNSILTVEQFELVKRIVDNSLFYGIPKTERKVGRR